jgi:hypothetical protein
MQWQADGSDILARIARGEPLADVLGALVRRLRGRYANSRACTLLPHGTQLTPVIDGELPADAMDALRRAAAEAGGRHDTGPTHVATPACWLVPINPCRVASEEDSPTSPGVLAVCLPGPAPLTPPDLEFLHAAAALAAVAIGQAALRDQLARHAQTLAEHERALAEQGAALAEQGLAGAVLE